MDALPFITEMLAIPALIDFLSENVPDDRNNLDLIKTELINVQIFMKRPKFQLVPVDKKQVLIAGVRVTAHKIGNFMSKIVGRASRKQSSNSVSHDLVKDWKETLDLISSIVVATNYLNQTEVADELEFKEIGAVMNSVNNIKRIENMLLETADSFEYTTLNEEESQAFLLMKAFPAIGELKEYSEKLNLLLELNSELDHIPRLICKACEGQPMNLLLIGGLLSLKQGTHHTWNSVKDDLDMIKHINNNITSNHIITYCYDDLPYFLKPCFLYFACYPIGFEIPVTSLIEIWTAEGFVLSEEGETAEDTANKYLQQLIQRSCIYVSKRSLSGTIKTCRISRIIHDCAIKQCQMDGFVVANPDQEEIESLFRLAIHQDNVKQYTEVTNNHMHSFLAFNFDKNVLGNAMFLRVMELRKSTIPITALPDMIYLRYLGLRGCNIFELPKDIGDMENLQTLDVRDTSIEILPESLWNIKKLRHVYVKPSPQNKGPPSAANIPGLQVLKTVAADKSWQENIPHFLIHLRKLAFSNWDNLDLKSISNLLSRMDKLISIAIMGNIIPSEAADTRAFPNLEAVKSIKLQGEWICRKLLIDNVKFPPNLTKLTLTKSGLKEDPMPTLGRLQALKFLSLQDEAYIGEQMVCTSRGFQKLQILELNKLHNLKNLEVKEGAMSKLTTLRVLQCQKLIRNHPDLGNHPNLSHVSDKVID